jgi:molybdenum-dependent DNA-binding transcriptional regulator ModE
MRVDGRKLDHAELEKLRFAAVKAVQEGKTPTEAARAVGVDYRRVW